jgi:hypothetical protein
MANIENQVVMFVALGIAIGIPFYLWRQKRNLLSEFDAFVKQRRMTPRTTSPVAVFTDANPPKGLQFSSAYDGQLRPGVPMTLLLLRRMESVIVQGVSIQNPTLYVGAYLPAQADFDANFLRIWDDKAQRRLDHVAYAARTVDSGFVAVWQGTPSRKNVEERLAELAKSLTTNRNRSA